jgi:4-aminobutyrate aminotransferase-like enzyme
VRKDQQAKVPGDFDKKTLLVTTGSEAVENAVKIARAATGRAGVIAFTGAYHGRTMMTLGLTGKVVPYSAGMGLMPGGIFRALFPNELHGVSVDDAIASSSASSRTTPSRATSPRSSSSRYRAKAASCQRRKS